MATLTIELPLNQADRDFLISYLRLDAVESGADKPAPAKKAAAKKAAATKPDPEPETAPEESSEDDAEEFRALVKETVKKASEVMKTDGGSDKVKAALDKVGAERVGRLQTPEQVAQFLDLIGASDSKGD